jgi:prevent-host-death family protein
MRLDFTPLPMTELRSRPGEILDRVVDGGEAFVIERNGRRQACLVPISVFLPDVSPARIAQELDQLQSAGEVANTTINDKKEVAIRIRHEQGDTIYGIVITLPHNYPNACPRVYVDSVEDGAPHRFADGALCIFGVMSSWNPAKHTARDALENARRWIGRYESWRRTGHWPHLGTGDGRQKQIV